MTSSDSAPSQQLRAPASEQSLEPLSASTRDFDPATIARVRRLQREYARMHMEYQSVVDEVLTKISILRREFEHLHLYNPIEHVSSRIKTLSSTLDKCIRRGINLTPDAVRAGLTDIAGVRITCSFISDTYRVLDILTSQSDITVREIKDYIATPKPNGYKSLHAIIELPVFLTTGPLPVTCEVQIRTIAMDFWASLEHKIYYKYDGDVPDHLASTLQQTAEVAALLDQNMEELHQEVRGERWAADGQDAIPHVNSDMLQSLWQQVHQATAPGDASLPPLHPSDNGGPTT